MRSGRGAAGSPSPRYRPIGTMSASTAVIWSPAQINGLMSSSATLSLMIAGETRNFADDIGEFVDIDGRHTAEPLQQFETLQAAQHIVRLVRGDGCGKQRTVFQQFDENAAQSDDDEGAEERVVTRADHQFHALRHHRLHEHAVDARRRGDFRGVGHDGGVGRAHIFRRAQIQTDDTGFGFVRQVG